VPLLRNCFGGFYAKDRIIAQEFFKGILSWIREAKGMPIFEIMPIFMFLEKEEGVRGLRRSFFERTVLAV
jgi:hypothetical protein